MLSAESSSPSGGPARPSRRYALPASEGGHHRNAAAADFAFVERGAQLTLSPQGASQTSTRAAGALPGRP
jgi:hypothetical protein